MLWLRNIVYWLLLCIFSLLWLPVVIVSMLFKNGVNWSTKFWALTLLWMLEHVIGLKYHITGLENIPNQPSIICCKHQSGWETLALFRFFPSLVFVAKRELFRIPVFGWALKWAGTIGIDRSNPKAATEQIIKQGQKCQNKGLWIVIFPEGTRVKPGFRGHYKKGAAIMSQLLHMNLVPVALNSGEFWPKNSFLKYPGVIDVVIGKSIHYDDADIPEELIKKCEHWIEEEQVKIQGKGPFAAKNVTIPTPHISNIK